MTKVRLLVISKSSIAIDVNNQSIRWNVSFNRLWSVTKDDLELKIRYIPNQEEINHLPSSSKVAISFMKQITIVCNNEDQAKAIETRMKQWSSNQCDATFSRLSHFYRYYSLHKMAAEAVVGTVDCVSWTDTNSEAKLDKESEHLRPLKDDIRDIVNNNVPMSNNSIRKFDSSFTNCSDIESVISETLPE